MLWSPTERGRLLGTQRLPAWLAPYSPANPADLSCIMGQCCAARCMNAPHAWQVGRQLSTAQPRAALLGRGQVTAQAWAYCNGTCFQVFQRWEQAG